jgi:hypothetical protein
MSRRAFTDKERTLTQDLLEKIRCTASNKDDGGVLYNPQAFSAMRSSLGHKSLTLAFVRSRLETIDKLQNAVIELVKHRLQAQNVHFPPLNVTNMSWCVPRALVFSAAFVEIIADQYLTDKTKSLHGD